MTTKQDMFDMIRSFAHDQGGAVTVDWVVLTAAIVGLAAGGMAAVQSSTTILATNVQTEVGTSAVDNGND